MMLFFSIGKNDAKHLCEKVVRSQLDTTYTMDTYPKKLSCSKKVVIVSFLIMITLIGVTVYGVFCTEKDMTALATLVGTSVVETAAVTTGYLWKAKAENKIKLVNQLIKDNADKYGIDAVVSLAGIVLSDT